MAQGLVNIIREYLLGPREEERCKNCELLQEQLSFSNYDRKMLLQQFVQLATPRDLEQRDIDTDSLAPLHTVNKFIPWRVRQQELEAESRNRAAHLRVKPTGATVTPESIEKLEAELLKGDNNGVPRQDVQKDE